MHKLNPSFLGAENTKLTTPAMTMLLWEWVLFDLTGPLRLNTKGVHQWAESLYKGALDLKLF